MKFLMVFYGELLLCPLAGFYDPEKSAEEGGIQLGNSDTNVYAQATMMVSLRK